MEAQQELHLGSELGTILAEHVQLSLALLLLELEDGNEEFRHPSVLLGRVHVRASDISVPLRQAGRWKIEVSRKLLLNKCCTPMRIDR